MALPEGSDYNVKASVEPKSSYIVWLGFGGLVDKKAAVDDMNHVSDVVGFRSPARLRTTLERACECTGTDARGEVDRAANMHVVRLTPAPDERARAAAMIGRRTRRAASSASDLESFLNSTRESMETRDLNTSASDAHDWNDSLASSPAASMHEVRSRETGLDVLEGAQENRPGN